MKNSSINKTLIGLTAIVALSVVGFAHAITIGPDMTIIYCKGRTPTDNVLTGQDRYYASYSAPYGFDGNWQYTDNKDPDICEYTCNYGYNPKATSVIIDGKSRKVYYCEGATGKRFRNRETKLEDDLNNKKLKNNILTTTAWDELMEELNNLNKELADLKAYTQAFDNAHNFKDIPAGAVMAFDLSRCPDGWSEFTEANGRFLLGRSGGGRHWTGGNSEITLNANQLPAHHHFMFQKGNPSDTSNDRHMLSNGGLRYVSTDGEDGADYTMNSLSSYSDKYYHLDVEDYSVDYGLTSSKLVNTQGKVISQQSINILNPYVNVIFCKKN